MRAQVPAEQTPPQSPAHQLVPQPQLIPRTHEERELRYQTQHRIILDVHVADGAGRAITGLQESDFTLLDNHSARAPVIFRAAKGGVSPALINVVLVLDAVNNSSRHLKIDRHEIEKYLGKGADPLPYPTSLAVFAGDSIEAGKPTQNRAALLNEVAARAPTHPTGCFWNQTEDETVQPTFLIGAGRTSSKSTPMLECLNHRFIVSVSALHRYALQQGNVPGRFVILWIGPGWPRLTDREFVKDTEELKQNRFQQIVDISTAFRESQITLDAVMSPDDSPVVGARQTRNYSFFEGVAEPAEAQAAHLGLHALAQQTGGQIFPVERDLAGQINACLADVENYYVLSFDTPPAAAFGEFHPLEIKVDRPGVVVRTSRFYYAEQ